MVIDLSDNNSLNNLFVNEFAKYFIHQDYTKEDLIFYRGNLIENNLKDIKSDENSPYQTAFVKIFLVNIRKKSSISTWTLTCITTRFP